MRIALFHNAPSGGAKRAIYEWTRRLTEHHQIDVYTLNSADHDFCDIRPFVQQYQVFDFAPRKLFNSPWGRLNQTTLGLSRQMRRPRKSPESARTL